MCRDLRSRELIGVVFDLSAKTTLLLKSVLPIRIINTENKMADLQGFADKPKAISTTRRLLQDGYKARWIARGPNVWYVEVGHSVPGEKESEQTFLSVRYRDCIENIPRAKHFVQCLRVRMK